MPTLLFESDLQGEASCPDMASGVWGAPSQGAVLCQARGSGLGFGVSGTVTFRYFWPPIPEV